MKKINALQYTMTLLAIITLVSCGSNNNTGKFIGIIEGETYTISTPVSEKLIFLSMTEGEEIKKNDILGSLDTVSLNLQKESMNAKIQQLEWQKKEIEVKKQQVVDAYNHAYEKYEKNLKLKKREAVPGQLVTDLKLQVDKWEKEKLALSAKMHSVNSGIRNLEKQIELIHNNIEKATLLSPIKGYVNNIYFEVGEYVPPMTPVADIVNLEKVWCYIYISESSLPKILPGQTVTGKINGWDTEIKGQILHINQKAEFTPKEILTPDNRQALVYAVKVSFENNEKRLKIGMPIEVNLEILN